MLPNCKGYEIPVWNSLLCWDTVDWESSLGRQAEGKPGRPLLVISLTFSWTEAEQAGALPLCTKPPTAHTKLSGAYTQLVNTAASGDYMATQNYMATCGS